jgi:hypothetical protein
MEDSFAGSFTAPEAQAASTTASEEHISDADDGNDHNSETQPLENDPADNNAITTSRTATLEAMISFLYTEAELAEERAKQLRNRAKDLAEQFGIELSHYHDNNNKHQGFVAAPNVDSDMAPLDEHGNPKYKGKRRGRKPKPRKRKHNPDREKRRHTGYTLFVQETHPLIKKENLNVTNAQIVSIVAKRWRDLSESQRRQWKERALGTSSNEDQVVNHHVHNDDQNVDAREEYNHVDQIVEGRKRTRRQR